MVLLGRIELPTSPLPRVRSTTELQQHTCRAAGAGYCAWAPPLSTSRLTHWQFTRQSLPMGTQAKAQTREERLAARLRENLRRRKQQARSLTDDNATESQTGEPPAQG